jgi:hypothetical protein
LLPIERLFVTFGKSGSRLSGSIRAHRPEGAGGAVCNDCSDGVKFPESSVIIDAAAARDPASGPLGRSA